MTSSRRIMSVNKVDLLMWRLLLRVHDTVIFPHLNQTKWRFLLSVGEVTFRFLDRLLCWTQPRFCSSAPSFSTCFFLSFLSPRPINSCEALLDSPLMRTINLESEWILNGGIMAAISPETSRLMELIVINFDINVPIKDRKTLISFSSRFLPSHPRGEIKRASITPEWLTTRSLIKDSDPN